MKKLLAIALLALITNIAYGQATYSVPNTVRDTGFLRLLSSGKLVSLTASQLAALVGGGGVADNSITFAKMQDIASDRLIGRDAAGSGDPTEISLATSLEFTGSNSIQRSALTGDVTASAGSNTTAIAAGVIVDADINASAGISLSKMATQGALSVVANATNATAVPTAVAAGSDDQVLRRSGAALGFGTVATGGIADGAVTNAKITSVSASKLTSGTLPGGFIFTVPSTSTARFDYVGGNPAMIVSTTANESSLFSQNGSQYVSVNNTNVALGAGSALLNFSSGGLLDLWDSDATHKITLKTPPTASLTSNVTIALPSGLGSSGQAVVTDGAGQWSYATVGGGGGGSPSVVTFAVFTADQDNLTMAGLDEATVIRVSGDNDIWAITSIDASGVVDGSRKTLSNYGLQPLILQVQHPDGTAANRFDGIMDFPLAGKSSVDIVYDGTLSRWLILSSTQSAHLKGNHIQSLFGSVTAADWGNVAFGTASGTTAAGNSGAGRSSGVILGTASVATGTAAVALGKNAATTYFGGGYIIATGSATITTLSTSGERHNCVFRLYGSTSTTSNTAVNQIGIEAVDNINSGNFTGYIRDNSGTRHEVNLGVLPTANAEYTCSIVVNRQLTETRFFLNGEYKGRITSGAPNPGIATPMWKLAKEVGTATRNLSPSKIELQNIYAY